MSFDLFTRAWQRSRPVKLYRFSVGAAEWLFTSHPAALEIGGDSYTPARGITHTALRESSAGDGKNQVTITIPYALGTDAFDLPPTQALGSVFWPWAPSDRCLVSISLLQLADPDKEVALEWIGRVVAPSIKRGEMELTCDPSYRAGFTGRVRRIQRPCDVPLYSQGLGMCTLDREDFAVAATLSAVSGLTLTASEFGAAPRNLAGGILTWTRSGGLVERRSIWAHEGSSITINYAGAELAAALEVVAYPGCAHNYEACQAYANEANYPGWRSMPTNEPMSRSQTW